MQRWKSAALCLGMGILAAGCGKGHPNFVQGKKAEQIQDYDKAYEFYQKASKQDPYNAEYKIRLNQTRFEASAMHVKRGQELLKKEDLQGAAAEFQRAQTIDPASPIAEQELRKVLGIIAEKNRATDAAADHHEGSDDQQMATMPPELKPLSRAPITLKMTNDAKIVFDTIGKLAGLTMIYDADFQARRIPVDLNNVTLEQALEIVSLESKTFYKPVTENIIFVIPDQPQKRRDYEEQVVETFYVANTVQPQDLTEIVTGLRTLLDLKRLQQVNSQNAIIIRDTPDKLRLARKMIDDIDRAKPEVVVQVEVLEARTDHLRNLGIQPGTQASIAINPNATTTTSPTTGTSTTPTNNLTLNQLRHLNGSDYAVTLPSLTANAVLTDSNTKIIQNPEVRSIDGQPAKLKIGDRIPIATGSFSSGIGLAGGTAGGISPLVNTQFTYLDVGVNIDMTPHVHSNRDVSLKLKVEVSSHTGDETIGGITQPIISQRTIEHDVRLREGESSVLAGLVQRTDTKSINGWPGLAKLPLLHYLFSDENKETQEDEVLIVLTPRIVRMPEWTKENLRAIWSGSETLVQVRKEGDLKAPDGQTPTPAVPPGAAPNPLAGATAPAPGTAMQGAATAPAKLRFEPANVTLKPGQTATLGVVVENVNDLFSIPMLLQYNPAVISIEEVRYGGFLSGGTQEIAIVSQHFKDKGQSIISATRNQNTPGVSGSGTLIGLVVKGVAPGSSNLSIVQVNAKDSQQKPIALVSSEATLQVKQ